MMPEGCAFAADRSYEHDFITPRRVTGGADAAIVAGLTFMLDDPAEYTHVGLVENDVLLHPDWLGPTMALFDRGRADGLLPGAVSARAYEDRVLIQRSGFAVMHNLGAGLIILTREAARIALDTARTHLTTDNRRTWMQLAGLDVARWWAFRGSEHMLCLDWGVEMELAKRGLASLALTPGCVDMIGQVPPLHEQGLTLCTEEVELLRNDKAFDTFVTQTRRIRDGYTSNDYGPFHCQQGTWTIFPHQIDRLDNVSVTPPWQLRWCQGFGPFANQATAAGPSIAVNIAGPCAFLVSGGPDGGQAMVEDLASGYRMSPQLPPESENSQVMNLIIPGNVTYRNVRLTALSPGVTFHGISVSEPQPYDPDFHFDWHCLPPA
jgi:hypothetical protein